MTEHEGPQFELLARIVRENDEAMDTTSDQDATFTEIVGRTIPIEVVSYVSLQRAMRGLGINSPGQLGSRALEATAAASAWLDGFVAGAEYERRRDQLPVRSQP